MPNAFIISSSCSPSSSSSPSAKKSPITPDSCMCFMRSSICSGSTPSMSDSPPMNPCMPWAKNSAIRRICSSSPKSLPSTRSSSSICCCSLCFIICSNSDSSPIQFRLSSGLISGRPICNCSAVCASTDGCVKIWSIYLATEIVCESKSWCMIRYNSRRSVSSSSVCRYLRFFSSSENALYASSVSNCVSFMSFSKSKTLMSHSSGLS
mmetsp:Transcript_8368/g.30953  ORF Transcript_8368/g.30953 Transcript_8368/m.30953 type:complete len:208 (-) Transcript_8368:1007-1630(-)